MEETYEHADFDNERVLQGINGFYQRMSRAKPVWSSESARSPEERIQISFMSVQPIVDYLEYKRLQYGLRKIKKDGVHSKHIKKYIIIHGKEASYHLFLFDGLKEMCKKYGWNYRYIRKMLWNPSKEQVRIMYDNLHQHQRRLA